MAENMKYLAQEIKELTLGTPPWHRGACFLCINCDYNEIPPEINSDDVECQMFWSSDNNYIIGKGDTPQEALQDYLYKCGFELVEDLIKDFWKIK